MVGKKHGKDEGTIILKDNHGPGGIGISNTKYGLNTSAVGP